MSFGDAAMPSSKVERLHDVARKPQDAFDEDLAPVVGIDEGDDVAATKTLVIASNAFDKDSLLF